MPSSRSTNAPDVAIRPAMSQIMSDIPTEPAFKLSATEPDNATIGLTRVSVDVTRGTEDSSSDNLVDWRRAGQRGGRGGRKSKKDRDQHFYIQGTKKETVVLLMRKIPVTEIQSQHKVETERARYATYHPKRR